MDILSAWIPIHIPPQPLRHPPLLAQLHPDIHTRLDPLEAGIHDADELQRRESPPRQRPQDVALLGVVDIQPVLAQYADLEGDLLDLLQRLPAKQPQRIQQIEDRIHAWPTGLQLSGRNPSQPISSQTAQLLGCLHLLDRLEMLLGRLHVSQLHVGEGEAVHGLRVQGIDLQGAAQVEEYSDIVQGFHIECDFRNIHMQTGLKRT